MLKSIVDIRLENVEKLMAESGLDRKDFAEGFDMTYNMFSQYFSNGKNRKFIGDKVAKRIEKAYNKPEFWLDHEHGVNNKPTIDQLRQQIADMQNPTHEGMTFQDAELVSMSDNSDKVPVISWVAAGSWSNIEEVGLDDVAIKWLSRPARLSKRGFALTVKGRSMLPEFKPEDIIFVEPETGFLMLKDGDLVVVSCNNDTEATFKQLVIGETSDDMYLKPLNPEWHEQRMMPIGECNLVGKVIGKYVEY